MSERVITIIDTHKNTQVRELCAKLIGKDVSNDKIVSVLLSKFFDSDDVSVKIYDQPRNTVLMRLGSTIDLTVRRNDVGIRDITARLYFRKEQDGR